MYTCRAGEWSLNAPSYSYFARRRSRAYHECILQAHRLLLNEAFLQSGRSYCFQLFSISLVEDTSYLVPSLSQIVWDERADTPLSVGATTPPLLYGPWIHRLIRVTCSYLHGQGPYVPHISLWPRCPTDSHSIPPSAHFRTLPTTCSVCSAETR